MCISKMEMDSKVNEYRSLKALYKETEEALKSIEREIISFLEETEECEDVNKKGEPIKKYIGKDYKATYSQQSRETVDKEEVKKLLDSDDYLRVSKVSTYGVLRIS